MLLDAEIITGRDWNHGLSLVLIFRKIGEGHLYVIRKWEWTVQKSHYQVHFNALIDWARRWKGPLKDFNYGFCT
jgi:hypothetical protein